MTFGIRRASSASSRLRRLASVEASFDSIQLATLAKTAWCTAFASMPDFFVEVPEGLAAEKGIPNGSQVRVRSKRGAVQGTAIVTKRIKPLRVNGKVVWTVGIPVHWGFVGLTQGSMANLLTPFVGDANTQCPEFKAFLGNLERA